MIQIIARHFWGEQKPTSALAEVPHSQLPTPLAVTVQFWQKLPTWLDWLHPRKRHYNDLPTSYCWALAHNAWIDNTRAGYEGEGHQRVGAQEPLETRKSANFNASSRYVGAYHVPDHCTITSVVNLTELWHLLSKSSIK